MRKKDVPRGCQGESRDPAIAVRVAKMKFVQQAIEVEFCILFVQPKETSALGCTI